MAYVPAQTSTVMNSDLTALNSQLAALQTARSTPTTGVNPRDTQLVQFQIAALKVVIGLINRRLNRLAKLS